MAILNLIRISRLTGDIAYEEHANDILKAFASSINNSPSVFSLALTGLAFASGPSYEIIITSDQNDPAIKEMLKVIRGSFTPNKVVILKDTYNAEDITRLAPYTINYNMHNGKTSVYVCQNFACSLPVTSVEELRNLLL